MMRAVKTCWTLLATSLGPAAVSVAAATQSPTPDDKATDRLRPIPQHVASLGAEVKIDPTVFFQKLVARYRGLSLYKDIINVVHITQREGHEPARVESRLTCEVADGSLNVKTPGSQTRNGLGVTVPMKPSQPIADAKRKYDLWLAPHMALKFTENPLKEIRAGVEHEFTATEAEAVTIDNKRMVHVELRSGCTGDGASEDCAARVDLYVNSESMLIERIEAEQRMPDGANYSTTLQITPEQVEGELAEDAEPVTIPVNSQTLEPAV